jgi:hypothetical protein
MHLAPRQKWPYLAANIPVVFIKIDPVHSALVHISHVPISWLSKRPHCKMAVCWTLYKHLPYPPHLTYMSTKLLPTNTSAFNDLLMSLSALSSARELAHALSIGTKVNLSGIKPSSCIFFEEFYRLLMLPCLASFLFQEKLSNCRVPGSIAASSATSHVGVCRSPSQSASCVFFLRLKSDRAFFSGLQSHHCEGSEKNSRQSFSLAWCCCGGCGSNRSTPIRG